MYIYTHVNRDDVEHLIILTHITKTNTKTLKHQNTIIVLVFSVLVFSVLEHQNKK